MRRLLVFTGLLAPLALVYALLWRSFTPLPFLDDYPLLQFALQLQERGSVAAKWGFVLTAQHNEYKLWFPHALVALQLFATGRVDFGHLAVLTDAMLALIGLIVWLIARQDKRAGSLGLVWFIPVAWLLFQLQYASALNWAEGGLQGLSVVAFALLAFWLCDLPSWAAFVGAVACMTLAVGSNANGLLVLPIGALQLWFGGSRKRLIAWAGSGAAIAALYLFRYQRVHHVQNGTSHMSFTYAAAFLGAVCTSRTLLPAVAGGVVFLLLFALATRQALYRSAPAIYSGMVFCLVTAAGLSGSRAEEYGLAQALASRYRLYSVLLLCLIYLFLAPYLTQALQRLRRPAVIVVPVAVLLVAFNLLCDRAGFRLLLDRREALHSAMDRYVSGQPPQAFESGADEGADIVRSRLHLGLYEPNRGVLDRARAAGVYRIP